MKTAFACLLWCTVLVTNAQSFDDLVSSNKYIDCQDVSFNAFPIIEKLYADRKIDRLLEFLDYWESKCGPNEPAFRIRNILKIDRGEFDSDVISLEWIDLLIMYRSNLEERKKVPSGLPVSDLAQRMLLLDNLSREMAGGMFSINEDETLLLDFYGSESPNFTRIRLASEASKLKRIHRDVERKTSWQPELHLAFVTGLSQNNGNISLFGTRPNFGLVMGGKQRRHNYDLVLDFRAGPSRDQYSFVYRDSLITDDIWTGMYVGLEYTYDFVHSKKLDVGLSPGIGYDRLTALTADNEYGIDPLFLSSFNHNLGLVFKYRYGRNGGYIGLHIRYNWVNYSNPGGTPLDGEYLNVRLTLGSIFDHWRENRLRNLE
ncbi:MAG: hypothetical protein AAGJ93_14445 [Bacteroidota bacterium]